MEFKSIKDRLKSGERVVLTKEEIAEKIEDGPEDALVVKHISLYKKLQELYDAGIVKKKKGRFADSKRFIYKNRKLRYITKFRGKSKWHDQRGEYPIFKEPHDLAIDPKTKMIIVSAPSIM